MPAVFDGVDDKIAAAGESSFDWERTSPISLAAWIKIPAIVGEAFLVKGHAATQRGIAFNTKTASGPVVHFHLTNTSGVHLEKFSPATVFQPFLWTHFAATYDGSSLKAGANLYRNGIALGAEVTPGADLLTDTILNNEPFSVGGTETGGAEFWNGSVCGVVADNAEWTATEVAELAKLANFYKPPSQLLASAPEIWLPISSKPGYTIFDTNDYSGNAHHGTIESAPTVEADPQVVIDWRDDGFPLSDSGAFTTTTSFSHDPGVSALQGALVFVAQNISSADLISAVTYGGIPMPRIATVADAAGEPGRVYAYFLGKDIPQGTQSVGITVASGTDAKHAWVFGFLSAGDVEVKDVKTTSGDLANPSVTLATQADFAGVVLSVIHSGQNAPSGVTPGAGYMGSFPGSIVRDYGTQVARCQLANQQGANIVCGWTQLSEDAAMIAVAVGPAGPSFAHPPTSRRPMPMMRGPDTDRRMRMGM